MHLAYNFPLNKKLYFLASHYIPHIAKKSEITQESNVKTLHSPLKYFRQSLSAEFSGHYVLSGGSLRIAMPFYQSKEMKLLPKYFIHPNWNRTYNRYIYSHILLLLRCKGLIQQKILLLYTYSKQHNIFQIQNLILKNYQII